MIKIDLKDAYWRVQTHPSSQKLQAIRDVSLGFWGGARPRPKNLYKTNESISDYSETINDKYSCIPRRLTDTSKDKGGSNQSKRYNTVSIDKTRIFDRLVKRCPRPNQGSGILGNDNKSRTVNIYLPIEKSNGLLSFKLLNVERP